MNPYTRFVRWGWILLVTAGCSSWRLQTVPLTKAMEARPNKIRVTSPECGTVVMYNPQLKADSVWGYSASFMPKGVYHIVPLGTITSWEVLESDFPRTWGLVVLLAPVVVVTVLLAANPPAP